MLLVRGLYSRGGSAGGGGWGRTRDGEGGGGLEVWGGKLGVIGGEGQSVGRGAKVEGWTVEYDGGGCFFENVVTWI